MCDSNEMSFFGISLEKPERNPLETIPANVAIETFKLPIHHLKHSLFTLPSIVTADLELVEMQQNGTSIYEGIFTPQSSFAKQVLTLYKDHYTDDTVFLQDTQQVISNMGSFIDISPVPMDTIEAIWKDVKYSPHFYEKYGYLEWDMLKSYNYSPTVLQSLTVANLISPIISFFLPLFILIIPFIILQIQGIPVSFSMYINILKTIAQHHFIGKALMTFESFSVENVIYFLGILGLYSFQMYQNTIQCYRFYSNIEKINTQLLLWKQYTSYSLHNIDLFLDKNSNLSTYAPFCTELHSHKKQLLEIDESLKSICLSSFSVYKTSEIGHMLTCYYALHSNEQYQKSISFSMGLEGYLELMKNTFILLKQEVIHKVEYTTDISNCSIIQQFYPPHRAQPLCVKNDISLNTYGIITGPNASGKTTFLKTTAINVILAQQIGVGFFDSFTLKPYTHLHSYLNIPDTSGRDSLFQAESRRCKEILQSIEQSVECRHFCIFDELFSGTNPTEATKAAYAFIEYIRQYDFVDLFLTTHYTSICEQWRIDASCKQICNYKMMVDETEQSIIPSYQLCLGISHIEGAIHIMKEMEYPDEIIRIMKNPLSVSMD